jgi:hypothetical protein
MENDVFVLAENECSSIRLTEKYLGKQYKNHFNDHLISLTEVSLMLNDDPNFILKKPRLKMTERLYYEIEGYVLEKLDDVEQEEDLVKIDELKTKTSDKVRQELGRFYRDDSEINSIIDYSVEGFVLSTKFELMSNPNNLINPWGPSKNILLKDNILHKFSTDMDYISDMGTKKQNSENQSEILKNTKIGVIGKGKKDGFTTAILNDMSGMRNLILNLMESLAPNSGSPINANRIVVELRKAGVTELDMTDSQIRAWLIYPLKRMSKIGSNKEGYFLFENCNDIEVSYFSHFENFKGFMNTLENHRNYALSKGCSPELDEHFKYMKRILQRNNKL